MRWLLLVLTAAGCGFTPSGLGGELDAPGGGSDDAAPIDGALGDVDAGGVDAAVIDAVTVDALAIDAGSVDAPTPIDPYCTGTGLVACFRMNDVGPPTDSHAPPVALARGDGVTYVPGCPTHGNALSPGDSTFVRTQALTPALTRFTAEAWVAHTPGALAGRQDILDVENAWSLAVSSSAGGAMVGCAVDQVDGNSGAVSAALPVGAPWVHVACSFDADRLRLFVNGLKVGEANLSNSNLANGGNGIQFGREAVDGAQVFAGLIDDVRVWNRRVPDGDIAIAAGLGCL